MKKGIVIKAENIYKTYGRFIAVKNLSFQVEEGSCFGFLGPNGAGKTTTLKIIYGKCLRDNESETMISVFGYDPKYKELQIKNLSGVVPQENNLDHELNVYQNLYIFSKFYGMSTKKANQRIDELLEFIELTDKKYVIIKALSGGMQRRLVIARALLNNPKLLILDEPTTGLDPQVRHHIWDKLRQLKKNGVTILLTTHYMEEAFQICDRILIMHNGEKAMEGNPHELLDKNIERYVLEVNSIDLSDRLETQLKRGDYQNIRKDTTKQRVLFYSNDLTKLKKLTDDLNSRDYYLREANLEDLFLITTGRGLNEKG